MRSTKRQLDSGQAGDQFYKRTSTVIGFYLSRGRTAGECALVTDLAYQLALASALADSSFRPLPWFTACGFSNPDTAARRVLAEVDIRREVDRARKARYRDQVVEAQEASA
jgi:hypothetical protein